MTQIMFDGLRIACVLMPLIAFILSANKRRWGIALIGALIGLFSTVVIWLMTISGFDLPSSFLLLHFTGVTSTVLLLVHLIGFVVLKYAHQNFALDADDCRFLKWYLITIFSVMLTVVSNHLLLLWLGWVSVSISLHQLLMFYPQRYRAVLAAHKKFIFARVAEFLLGLAFLIVYAEHGTAYMNRIFSHYPVDHLSFNLHIAALLISVVVLIKCAQLPLHGWLIQVVESPTPVSALLHAGIINMGGLLLLIFAPLFSQSLPAQALLLVVASCSAVLASLIMMSVPSVKVRLAWSTIAQMGLMLIECALGLYAIALLHLLAHSVYKAHAFLSAGEAVQQHVMRLNAKAIPQILDWQLAIWVALCVLFAASYLGWVGAPYSPWMFLTGAAIVLLANSDLLSSPFKAIVPVVVMVLLYLIFKQAVTSIWPEIHHAYVWQFDGLVSLLLIGLLMAHISLFVVQRKQTALFPLLNTGFYLDEWSTRITLKIWPIRLPKKPAKHQLLQGVKHDISKQAQVLSKF